MARTFRPLVTTAALLLASLGAGCLVVDTGPVGNTWSECRAGAACGCSVVGNCVIDCPGGGCDLTCGGVSNCLFSCGAGGCTVECANTGNCEATCAGGGCAMTCTGTGNGILSGCPSGCTAERVAGAGTCAVTGG